LHSRTWTHNLKSQTKRLLNCFYFSNKKSFEMKKVLYAFGSMITIVSLLFLSSCTKEDKFAQFLVTHASPDASGFDLLIDDKKVSTSAITFANNTGYLDVAAGGRNVKVNLTGTMTGLINTDLTLEEDKAYSLFVINRAANIEAVLLEDNLSNPSSGKAHLRFGHLSPDAPEVDIKIKGGAVIFPNAKFKKFTAFTPLDAGTYNLEVILSGTSIVRLSIPPISLEAGKIYTVFAKGLLSGGSNPLGAQIMVNK
jgi:hypothetical protein